MCSPEEQLARLTSAAKVATEGGGWGNRPTSEQGAGLGGSKGIITGGDPDQKRVLGGILQTEVSQLSSSLGHLQSQTQAMR